MASRPTLSDVDENEESQQPRGTAPYDQREVNNELHERRKRKREKANLAYLTVNQKAKIEKEEEAHNKTDLSTSKAVVIIKWAVTILFGGLLLGTVSLSKLTVIGLSTQLTSEDSGNTAYVMLLIIVEVPYVLSFIRSIWTIIGRSDMPWPTKWTFFWCVLTSFLESFGICLLVFKSFTMAPAIVAVLSMNAVVLFPTFNYLGKSLSRTARYSPNAGEPYQGPERVKKFRPLLILSAIAATGGVALTIVCSLNLKLTDTKASDIWHIAVGIVCISVTWSPSINERLLRSKPKKVKEVCLIDSAEDFETSFTIRSNETDGQSSRSSTYPNSSSGWSSETQTMTNFPVPTEVKEVEKAEGDCTHRSLALTSGLKIPLIFIFSYILFYVEKDSFVSMDESWSEFKSGWNWNTNTEFLLFIANISSSITAYVIGVFACRTCMNKGGFALPLFLVTPVVTVLLLVNSSCKSALVWDMVFDIDSPYVYCDDVQLGFVIPAAIALCLAQILTTSWVVLKSTPIVLQKERKLFWQLTYNSVLLEQWLLLNRRSSDMTEEVEDPRERGKRSNVYICTTMYHENRNEMKQLLESINLINKAQRTGSRHFESHIFLDGAVKGEDLTEYALQLVSLLKQTLEIKQLEMCTKTLTPYGMKLTWELPGNVGQKKMTFTIHLKDNKKVKSKKRWSQIMYMSYVLDFLNRQNVDNDGSPQDNEDEAFILTTDADVKFTPQSVEALLDLMTRDTRVGAVCARTHPLGEGPLVWYQKFEYAIGHWFQKVAEHVLGSVLCAPGCFSVYRCSAIRDIVPTYASTVMKAFDFLIKDMGEDRWLCTLMVQSGWRIEYCAASENETYCPEEFEEFYKQRRRWIASTLANIMSLIRDWRYIRMLNHRVSILFCLYQIFLLCSTFVGPSTVILVVSGGLTFAWDISLITTAIIQAVVCVGYTFICLYGDQNLQMKASKVLTFFYGLVMTAVAVGIAEQVADDFTPNEPPASTGNNGTDVVSTTPSPNAISLDFPVSVTTIYLGGLIGIFLATGLLHPREFLCLLNGVTYLLCLPSGYLILNIYSICNITDRTWGTREKKKDESEEGSKAVSYLDVYQTWIRKIFFCCFDREERDPVASVEQGGASRQRGNSESEVSTPVGNFGRTFKLDGSKTLHPNLLRSVSTPGAMNETIRRQDSEQLDEMNMDEDGNGILNLPIPVDVWMPNEMQKEYLQKFKNNGYENTMMISSMTDQTLKEIGVKKSTHRSFLMAKISDLPDFTIDAALPTDVESWLYDIGLSQYKDNFDRNQIKTVQRMENLKSFTEAEIKRELGIVKKGHIERLKTAISMLRVPTAEEVQNREIRNVIDRAFMHEMDSVNAEEHKFWSDLIKSCLKPSPDVFTAGVELKDKLVELRNNWLMVYGVVNCLWLVVILTLSGSVRLQVVGTNPLSVVFLAVFGFIFVLQFLCMLVHRFTTFSHYVARAPYRFGQAYRTAWAFSDSTMGDENDINDSQVKREIKEAEKSALRRIVFNHKPKRRDKPGGSENQSLIRNGGHSYYSNSNFTSIEEG